MSLLQNIQECAVHFLPYTFSTFNEQSWGWDHHAGEDIMNQGKWGGGKMRYPHIHTLLCFHFGYQEKSEAIYYYTTPSYKQPSGSNLKRMLA